MTGSQARRRKFCHPGRHCRASWGQGAGLCSLVEPGGEGTAQPPPFLAGVASVVVSFFLSMYYNVINAWGFWYLFHSFQVSGACARAAKGKGDGASHEGPRGARRLRAAASGSREVVHRAGGGGAPPTRGRASDPGIDQHSQVESKTVSPVWNFSFSFNEEIKSILVRRLATEESR